MARDLTASPSSSAFVENFTWSMWMAINHWYD